MLSISSSRTFNQTDCSGNNRSFTTARCGGHCGSYVRLKTKTGKYNEQGGVRCLIINIDNESKEIELIQLLLIIHKLSFLQNYVLIL